VAPTATLATNRSENSKSRGIEIWIFASSATLLRSLGNVALAELQRFCASLSQLLVAKSNCSRPNSAFGFLNEPYVARARQPRLFSFLSVPCSS